MSDWQQLRMLFQLPDEEDIFNWKEEDRNVLREAVLRDALDSILDARNSAETRAELWRWVYTDTGPFSFDACARAVGVDPHELRVTFGRLVERQAIQGEADEAYLEKTAELLAAYLEEPAARTKGHAHRLQ